jgi:hypothetical protein
MDPSADARIVDVTAGGDDDGQYAARVAAEAGRRDRQRTDSLEDLERHYHGPEVGAIRRHMNRVTRRHIRVGGDLLDYGCGGAWWKDGMWDGFDTVTAAEIDRGALIEVGDAYPQAVLWQTTNGIIDSDRRFDVVLSSSVLGYIHPDQGPPHIACCHRLLKDGGQLVLTRVLAHGLTNSLRRRRLVAVEGGSFAYHYSRRDLTDLLGRHGFRDIRPVELGIRIPGLPWSVNQALYGTVPGLMGGLLPPLLPFLRIQHMLLATK